MTFEYHLEIRHCVPQHIHHMQWRTVSGAFNSRADLDDYAAYIMRNHPLLDVRGIRKDGSLTHTINYRVRK